MIQLLVKNNRLIFYLKQFKSEIKQASQQLRRQKLSFAGFKFLNDTFWWLNEKQKTEKKFSIAATKQIRQKQNDEFFLLKTFFFSKLIHAIQLIINNWVRKNERQASNVPLAIQNTLCEIIIFKYSKRLLLKRQETF